MTVFPTARRFGVDRRTDWGPHGSPVRPASSNIGQNNGQPCWTSWQCRPDACLAIPAPSSDELALRDHRVQWPISGRHYTTPIAYVQDGNRVLLSTDSTWWRNLSGGAQVCLRLRGRDVVGTATPLLDPAASLTAIRQLTDAIASYARMAGLASKDGQVPDSEIVRQIQEGRVAIEVTLGQFRITHQYLRASGKCLVGAQ